MSDYESRPGWRLLTPEEIAAMVTWQPIGTAPKDGSRVIAWRAGWENCAFVRWALNPRTGTEFWNDDQEWDAYENEECPPTHWLPLPPLP